MNWRLGLIFAVVLVVIVWLAARARSGRGQP